MGIGYILVLLFAGYGALKYFGQQKSVAKTRKNRIGGGKGVQYFAPVAVSQRAAQQQSYKTKNTNSVTKHGFAPAFGPDENMPSSSSEIYQ